MSTHKILDLFAGAGGLSLGFELVRRSDGSPVFEVHRAVEIDPVACKTLRLNHGDDKVIEGDLTKRSVHKKVVDACKGEVSVIVGGIPCQSFSLIGPRSGLGRNNEKFKEDERDHLYKEFKSIVKEVDPKIIVLENVKGILSKRDSKGRLIVEQIIKDFERLGYSMKNPVTGKSYVLLNAADYGVPQLRERVIMLGVKKSWKKDYELSIPATHADPLKVDRVYMQEHGLLPYVTLAEAIGDLPKLKPLVTKTGLSGQQLVMLTEMNSKANPGRDEIRPHPKLQTVHCERLSDSGRSFLSFVRPDSDELIRHHVCRPQQLTDIELFRQMKQGEVAGEFFSRVPHVARKLIKYEMNSFKDKYRRQIWRRPSTTIFAHMSKDGNRFIHPTQARTFTPREAARLQSFPDSYVFEGSVNEKFKQIGNAVPPLLAMHVAKSVHRVIESK